MNLQTIKSKVILGEDIVNYVNVIRRVHCHPIWISLCVHLHNKLCVVTSEDLMYRPGVKCACSTRVIHTIYSISVDLCYICVHWFWGYSTQAHTISSTHSGNTRAQIHQPFLFRFYSLLLIPASRWINPKKAHAYVANLFVNVRQVRG